MQRKNLVVVSKDESDMDFFREVASVGDLRLQACRELSDVHKTADGSAPYAFVWRLEDQLPEAAVSKAMQQAPRFLSKFCEPQLAFILSDLPVFHRTEFLKDPTRLSTFFRHNLIRKYQKPASKVFARIINAAFEPEVCGLAPYFPSNVRPKKITIQSTGERADALEAVKKFLAEHDIDSRLSVKVSQAVDELLLNAIFDAPWIDDVEHLERHHLGRQEQFQFKAGERVVVETRATVDYLGICVTDYFGSLNRERVLSCIGRNFVTKSYVPDPEAPNAGLGLYRILRSGISLILSCQVEAQTDAMIVFPRCDSYKEFKQAFQAVAYFEPLRVRRKLARDEGGTNS